jgi:uncharacterized protein (TIGR02271 family)
MTANTTIPLVREELKVDTEWVETGRVRVRKQVQEHAQQVDMLLAEEEVDIRYVDVGTIVDQPPQARYEGDTLVVPILEEILVVEKRYRIKQELHIRRHSSEHLHSATVPVRVEQAVVERFEADQAPFTG